jgi:hypothetical protein
MGAAILKIGRTVLKEQLPQHPARIFHPISLPHKMGQYRAGLWLIAQNCQRNNYYSRCKWLGHMQKVLMNVGLIVIIGNHHFFWKFFSYIVFLAFAPTGVRAVKILEEIHYGLVQHLQVKVYYFKVKV